MDFLDRESIYGVLDEKENCWDSIYEVPLDFFLGSIWNPEKKKIVPFRKLISFFREISEVVVRGEEKKRMKVPKKYEEGFLGSLILIEIVYEE